MRIELKAINYSAWNSQETPCYQGNLYVNGNKIGIVGNDGHGGCDYFHGDHEFYRTVDTWLRENSDDEFPGVESECGRLLESHLAKRDVQNHMKKKILVVEGDKIMAVGFKGIKGNLTPAMVDRWEKTNGKKSLNSMPLAEAVKIFMEKT